MTEYGTIKIPKESYDKHNEARQAQNLTWEQYLNQEGLRDTGTLWTEAEIRELVRAEISQARRS